MLLDLRTALEGHELGHAGGQDQPPLEGDDRLFIDVPRSEYLWCLHCERTYERGKWRTIDGLQRCPYLDCDGDAVLDAIDWAEIRDANPAYPEKPSWGTRYAWESGEE